MKQALISEAVGRISDRYIEEALDFDPKASRSMWSVLGGLAACLCVCALLGTVAVSVLRQAPPTPPDESPVGTPLGGTPSPSGTAATPATVRGVAFTQEELDGYIADSRALILTAVQAEYTFPIRSVAVYRRGVYHVSCGAENVVNTNAVSLPILVNGEWCAHLDVVRADDAPVKSVSIGGNSWEHYNHILFESPNREAVFAYLPEAAGEILLLPDNTFVVPPTGETGSLAAVFGGDANWYALLKTKYNTLSAEELTNPQNTVIIFTE